MELEIKDFNLIHTFECGQCFRWEQNSDLSYTGIVNGEVLNIAQKGERFIMSSSSLWEEYLDLKRDYGSIKRQLSKDKIMERAIKRGEGIRLLNQSFFETLISFIISQNNNIPRIKSIILNFCREFGEKIEGEFYSFPTPYKLKGISEKDLSFLKCGYRSGYICDATEKVLNNEINFNILKDAPIEKAREEICKIKGVGPKVADCILLFSVKRSEVFPTDVWMKKVLTEKYNFNKLNPKDINDFAKARFGDLSGYAQQYLFYSMREEK